MADDEKRAAQNAQNDDVQRIYDAGEIPELAVVAEGEDRTTWFVWMLVGCACISGLLFGYDTGVISGALVSIGSDLGPEKLSHGQSELITSATTLGALLGSIVAGIISDYVGRKWVLGAADIIFIVGAIIQAVSHTVWTMIGGRFVIGVAVGVASGIAPLFIQELAPTRQRGRMVVLNVVSITGGQVIAYGIGAGFEHVAGGWRYMVGLGAVPAAIQFGLLFLLPESPRILLLRNDATQTAQVLQQVYPYATTEQVQLKVRVLQAAVRKSVQITETTTVWERMYRVIRIPANRRALIIACGLQAYQQLSGFNSLMYFSATLFASVGFDNPTAVGLIVAGTNFLFTLLALKYIDRVGRRRIMLISAPGMVIGLTVASVAFYEMTKKTGGQLLGGEDGNGVKYATGWTAVVLVSMIVYVASYASGLGNVPWQQGELFSLDVRGIGTSLATASNWSGNLIIGSTYLSLMAKITPAGAFGFYAGLCFLGWIFCIFCFPETAGLSLEEVTMIFSRDFGIRAAERLRKDKAAMKVEGTRVRSMSDIDAGDEKGGEDEKV